VFHLTNNNTFTDESYQIQFRKQEGKKNVFGKAPETVGEGKVANERI